MKPRPLTERDQTLIDLYGYCQLGMTPQQFYAKWQVNHEVIAFICSIYQLAPISAWVLHPQDNDASSDTLSNLIQRALTKQPSLRPRGIHDYLPRTPKPLVPRQTSSQYAAT
jgi:hypothetical protein